MLRLRITIVLFFVFLLAVLILNHYYFVSLVYLVVPISFLVIILTIAAFQVNSQFYVKTICYGANHRNEVALTFDDGPEKPSTASLLEILKKHGVLATFFCIGEKINGNQNLLLQMHREGHLLGNHTYSHSKWFDLFPAKKMAHEFEKTNEQIFQITGEKPVFFRPPYGVTNPSMRRALKKFNFTAIGWRLRSFDTLAKSKDKVLQRVIRKIKPGDIILFHDHLPFTPEVIDEFIPVILSKGLKIVRLDQLINPA